MKISKVAYLCLLIIPAAASFAQAQAAPGKVIVASANGNVEAVDAQSKARSLKTKDVISQNHTVNVGEASAATLVFGNGAILSMQQNSSLEIAKFLQDPFSTPFAMATETEEPSVSSTTLNLVQGEVIMDVKKLRIDDGSSLTINTPVGAAGVRGTTFAITYTPAPGGGKGTYTLSVTEGSVTFTDANGDPQTVEAGQEVEITFTSINGVVKITSMKNQAISDARAKYINDNAGKGKNYAKNIVHNVTDELLNIQALIEKDSASGSNPKSVTNINP